MSKITALLYNLGQSVWIDNITRGLLDSGTLKKYMGDLSVTGLTSNPTIFNNAISVCCGPAPGPKIRTPRNISMSKLWPPRTRSTPCRRRRC